MKMTSYGKQQFLVDFQRHLRERGWNLSKLAENTGIHQSQISRIAAGDFKTFGSNIMRICMEFGMRPEAYYTATPGEDDRDRIANAAISIWNGTRRDTGPVVSLLREIAKLRRLGVRR